ncbi:MAG TPA: hypothetical protein VMS31_16125 [Pyrinomonadaceae bacterium]|nr:hypothetical protein [Pyrinomonadaceae bacterium]
MQHAKTRKLVLRLSFVVAILLVSAAPIFTQTASAVSGRWVWKQVARKNKPQTQFTLVIHHQGNKVHGVYNVDEFINGKWQGEDGNQTPFSGRVNGSIVEIEFDPSATVPGYQENVTYAAPTDGRKPSGATLTLSGPALIWKVVTPPGIEGVPDRLTLKRERNGRR